MKRQNILIAVFAALLILAAVAYFIFIRPLALSDAEPDETEPVETEEGEVASAGGRLFMFSSLSRDEISSVKVKNQYGSFTFNNTDDGFVIEGHEKVNYSKELLATLISVSGNTLSKTKVGSSLSDEKIAEYGLDDPQASWTVTDKKGSSFTVYVGDRLLTGGGYYCMPEGRRSVYVLDTDVERAVLCPVEDYVEPVLVAGISKDDYYVCNNFTVYRDGDMMLRIRLLDKKDQNNPDALAENIMDFPTAYYPDSSLYYDIIYSYMNLTAGKCYKLGATARDMVETGLDNPAHRITLDYKNVKYELCFSKLTDGVYYAYSNLYPDVIGVCDASEFKYLEYDLIDWIDEYIFHRYITDISRISIKTPNVSAEYALSHSIGDDDSEILNVRANGKDLSADECANFRQYYKSLLSIAIGGYCKDDEFCNLSEAELAALAADTDSAYLTFEYTTLAGKTTTLRFYPYSARRSLMTVDGVGEFYVLTDLIKKIENDTVKILNGEEVMAHDKY